MAYAYKIKAYGVKLDYDSCPPELSYKIFPNGDWDSVTVEPNDKYYEFVFKEKQAVNFKSEFIEITETEI